MTPGEPRARKKDGGRNIVIYNRFFSSCNRSLKDQPSKLLHPSPPPPSPICHPPLFLCTFLIIPDTTLPPQKPRSSHDGGRFPTDVRPCFHRARPTLTFSLLTGISLGYVCSSSALNFYPFPRGPENSQPYFLCPSPPPPKRKIPRFRAHSCPPLSSLTPTSSNIFSYYNNSTIRTLYNLNIRYSRETDSKTEDPLFPHTFVPTLPDNAYRHISRYAFSKSTTPPVPRRRSRRFFTRGRRRTGEQNFDYDKAMLGVYILRGPNSKGRIKFQKTPKHFAQFPKLKMHRSNLLEI